MGVQLKVIKSRTKVFGQAYFKRSTATKEITVHKLFACSKSPIFAIQHEFCCMVFLEPVYKILFANLDNYFLANG